MQRIVHKKHAGDTMVEVMFAIAIFCMIMILSINLMNNSLNAAQATLESTMARNAIDSQAEGLRFIHDSYVMDGSFKETWRAVISGARDNEPGTFPVANCNEASKAGAFVLNLKDLTNNNPSAVVIGDKQLTSTSTYPQIEYENGVKEAKGIWVVAVADKDNGSTPRFYDFHIRACWDAPGKNVSSSLDTVIRLYNPGGDN